MKKTEGNQAKEVKRSHPAQCEANALLPAAA